MLHYFNLSHYLTLILPILLHGSVPSQRLNQLIVQGISNTLDAVSKAIRNDERATTNQRVPIDKSTPTNSHADTSSPRPASDTSPPLSPSIIPPSLVSNQVTPTMTIQSFDMDFDIDPNNNSNNNKPAKPSPSESQRQRQTPPQRPRSRRTDLITRNQRASQQKQQQQQQQQQQRMLRERYNSVSQHRYYHWMAVGVPLMENKWANVITPTLVLALLPEPQRPLLSLFPNPTFGLLGPSNNPPNTPSPSSSSSSSFPFTRTRNVVQVQIDQKRVTSLRADARSLMNKMKSCEDYELKDIPTKWAYSMPTLTMTRTMSPTFTPTMTSSTATSSNNIRQRRQGQFDEKEGEDKTLPPTSSPPQPPSSPSSSDDHSNLFQPLVEPLSLISSSGQRIRLHR